MSKRFLKFELALLWILCLCGSVALAQNPLYTDAYLNSINKSWQAPCGEAGTVTQQIAAALIPLKAGGTLDLTCYTSPIIITQDIFSPITAPVTVILPPVAVYLAANVTIPSNFEICPRSGSSLAAVTGAVTGSTLNAAGNNYVDGDTGTVGGTCVGTTYQILSAPGGHVATYSITAAGASCTIATGVLTAAGGDQPGIGSGFKVNITTTGYILTNNSISCNGGSGDATLETLGSPNTSQILLNFIASTTNASGLTVTPSNPSGGQEKFEVTGSPNSLNGAAVPGSKAALASNAARQIIPATQVFDVTDYGAKCDSLTDDSAAINAAAAAIPANGGTLFFPPANGYSWCMINSARIAITTNNTKVSGFGAGIVCNVGDDCISTGNLSVPTASSTISIEGLEIYAGTNSSTHSAIRDNGQGDTFRHIVFRQNGAFRFAHLIENDDDQKQLVDDLYLNGAVIKCDSSFCGSAIWGPGPYATNAGITYVTNSNIQPECSGNGVDYNNGNKLGISNTVIEGFNQFGVRSTSGGSVTLTQVYQEVGSCTNPLGNLGAAGLISAGSQVSWFGGQQAGDVPVFPQAGSTGSTNYGYYVVGYGTSGVTAPLAIGYLTNGNATINDTNNIVTTWNDFEAGNPTFTYDLLRYPATSPKSAPNGTGNWAVATGLTEASVCSGGICTYTDTVTSPSSYAVASSYGTNYWPKLSLWPGAVVLSPANGYAASYTGDALWQGGAFVCSYGTVTVFGPLAYYLSDPQPFGACAINAVGVENTTAPEQALLLDPAYGSGLKGVLNLGPRTAGVYITYGDALTVSDSDPDKTKSNIFGRPAYDAADAAVCLDGGYTQGGLCTRAGATISNYINHLPDGTSWLERLVSNLKTFKVPITTNQQITSTLAIGTPPFVVTSTTPVANLNIGGNAVTATDIASYTSFSVFGSGNAAKAWITPTGNSQCLMSDPTNFATVTPSFQACLIGFPRLDQIDNPNTSKTFTMGANTLTFSTTTALNQLLALKNVTPAIVSLSQGSPVGSFCGRAFTTVDAEDCMTLSELPGNGANAPIAFNIGHTGPSSGVVSLYVNGTNMLKNPFSVQGQVLISDASSQPTATSADANANHVFHAGGTPGFAAIATGDLPTIPLTGGGTNATSAPAALVNLFPAGTRKGDILLCTTYAAGACSAWTLLAGNDSGTAWFQENSGGVGSWSVPPGTGTVTASGTPAQYDDSYWTTATNLTKITAPATKGTFVPGYKNPTDAATAKQIMQAGSSPNTVTGATYTIGAAADDCSNGDVFFTYAGAVAVSLPTSATLENPHCAFSATAGKATTVTITPASSWPFYLNGDSTDSQATLVIAPKQSSYISVDVAGSIWDAIRRDAAGYLNGISLAGLGTGILKNTTGTGVPSIATPADLPAPANLGAITWNNAGNCTFAAASTTNVGGHVTTVTGESCTLVVTNPVTWGSYVLEVINGSGAAATFTLGACASGVFRVGGAGAGAVTLSGASAIDVLAFTFNGTDCLANFRENFN